jgi:purine-binding chemotaxis protein CheW
VKPPATGQWVTFLLDGEVCAVAVEEVQEALLWQPLTPVPLAPPQMVGLLNLRGQLMPAIDLRRRLGLPAREAGEGTSQLVLRTAEGPVSVLVDEVGDVLELPAAMWRPAPDTLSRAYRRFVMGVCPVPGGVVIGLRAARLGFDEEDAA